MTMAGLVMLSIAVSGCIQENCYESEQMIPEKSIVAFIEQTPMTRVCIDPETSETGGSIAYYWTPEDEIGVFTDEGENNVLYYNTEPNDDVKSVTFFPSTEVYGLPEFAYFPYSENAGTDFTALNGNVPMVQTINESLDNIPGMYRYGYHKDTSDDESSFGFRHVMATIRWHLDVTGTELEGRKLNNIQIKVQRGTRNISVCGDFTFNAATGSYKAGANTSNEVTINFEEMPVLENELTIYTSLFPSIKKGDYLYFTVNSVGKTATYKLKSAVTFQKNYAYTFSMPINEYSNLNVYPNGIVDPDEVVPEPEQPSGPTSITGTFTCAAHNVDGLPDISYLVNSINPDGPGENGTKTISSKLAASNWDFAGFSEDFNYHSALTSAATGYTFQTFDNETLPSSFQLSMLSSPHWKTDGLSFAAKNSTCRFKQITKVEFTSEAGGLFSGANTCVDKGFRHFELTLTNGTDIENDDVTIDVIVTHMNTYSSDGNDHINAQHAQLKQIAQYINSIIAVNKRPVIFMGDTNCRYTRHDFKTYFWDVLSSNLIVNDPWVDFQWNGVYPTYPSKSLMVSDATGTDPETDIICENTQKGEVVDKVIYINTLEADTFIGAISYLRDYEGYYGLGDHYPIVVEFGYEKIIPAN